MSTLHRPLISMIVAMAANHVIGNGDKIPWHIREDFKYFKEKTLGKPVIMGRKTFESIHAMKGSEPTTPALPHRHNIIITRQNDYAPVDCSICGSVSEAITVAQDHTNDEIMILGGGTIYAESMTYADRLYITMVDGDYEGDIFFPPINAHEWTLTSTDPKDGFSFLIYDRIKP